LASSGFPKRFLPPDPRVEEPYRLTPQIALRVAVLGFLALTVFAVLFLRAWSLQILAGDKYLAAANDNRVRTLSLEAKRGPVLDVNGKVLVQNTAGFRVELWPADLPKTWPAERAELRSLSHVVAGVSVARILALMKAHGNDPLTPVVVQTGLHRDQVYYLKEHAADFPGVRVANSWLRKYPYQSLLAQVLGYVGPINADEYKALKKQGYNASDSMGQAGIEKTYDSYLRGHDGSAQLTVNSLGVPTSQVKPVVTPQPGEALRLTIDINLQRAAERALVTGIQAAHAAGEGFADGGAIVALDPRDGAVRAMASYPTYKPSLWAGHTNEKKLAPLLNPEVAKEDNYPGLNRALQVGYPPGSTFKPVTALAAIQEHLLNPYDLRPCTPDYKAYGQVFHNWTPYIDQGMDLVTALEESCDTYFYPLGKAFYELPPDRGHPLQAWANRFGLGEPTGIDLTPESDGLVPTPEWRRETFAKPPYTEIDRTWKPGYSIQLAIGQGDLLVTPLQMARVYAMIANGGKLVTPHVADDVELAGAPGHGPQRVLRRFGGQPPQPVGVDPAALSVVQQGLYKGAHDPNGTSYGAFGDFPVPIAGKTGTAEKIMQVKGYPNGLKLNQSWWCGYGPFDDPDLVVCAVIENGGEGGAAAAPAAQKVFSEWFHKTGTLTQHASD
jgi:penicillin-binding protein 2